LKLGGYAPGAAIRARCEIGTVHVEEVYLPLCDTQAVNCLPPGQATIADADLPDFLAALSLGTIKYQAKDVEPEFNGNLKELVLTTYRVSS
jgi:hypothetical protein